MNEFKILEMSAILLKCSLAVVFHALPDPLLN